MFNWNISEVGKMKPVTYCGFKTKKEAIQVVEDWNSCHELKIEVIKYKEGRWQTA